MYVCMHRINACMHICMCACLLACIHLCNAYTCKIECIHTCVPENMCVCQHVCMYARMYEMQVCTCECMYVRMNTCLCMCMYASKYTYYTIHAYIHKCHLGKRRGIAEELPLRSRQCDVALLPKSNSTQGSFHPHTTRACTSCVCV